MNSYLHLSSLRLKRRQHLLRLHPLLKLRECFTMGDFIRTWDINCIPYSYYHIIFEKVFGEGAADRCG